MQTIISISKQVGLVTIALTLALAANFAYGQWTNPTQAPTGGNVATPINTATGYQTKAGNIGAFDMLAANKMRSDQYCNLAGTVCASIEEMIGGGSTYSWNTSSWGACAGACGTTGTQSRSVSCRSSAGQTVSNALCSGTRPASTRSCSTGACACNTIPQKTITMYGSCGVYSGTTPPACPTGYTQQGGLATVRGLEPIGCAGTTNGGNENVTQQRTCVRAATTVCEGDSTVSYPTFDYTRSNVCGITAYYMGCGTGFTETPGNIPDACRNSGGLSVPRYGVRCTLPAETFRAP